jgi:hypothetical protein
MAKFIFKPLKSGFPKKEAGIKKLDYSVPEEAGYVLERFGGESFLKDKYPLVYQAILNTRELHGKQSPLNSLKSGSNDSVVDSYDAMTDIAPAPKPAGNMRELKNGGETVVAQSSAWFSTSRQLSKIFATGWMVNVETGSFIDTYAEEYDNPAGLIASTLRGGVENVTPDSAGHLQSFAEWHIPTETNDAKIVIESYADHTAELPVKALYSLVKEFTITDPHVKSAADEDLNKNPLIVLYNRTVDRGESYDYNYPNNKASNNLVSIKLPISGSITFYDTIFPKGLATGQKSVMWLYFEDEGGVQYARDGIAGRFTVDASNKHKINFSFPKDILWDDWNATANLARFSVSTTFDLNCSFFIEVDEKDGNGTIVDTMNVPCSIKSSKPDTGITYYVSGNAAVNVPQIRIKWGCFSKDTAIRIWDGSDKVIGDIKKGEKLLTADGKTAVVENIVTGKESEIVVIATEGGRRLGVTATHPIKTTRGIIPAGKLRPLDELCVSDGGSDKIKYVYLTPYNDTVYNLDTGDKPALLIANGIIAGDFEYQNSGVRESEAAPEASQQLRETIAQMHTLYQELHGAA